jgi:hypothetical protein
MLIPTTFVALASIMIVLFAEYKNGFGGIPTEHASFDPSNSLHLMAAASAGGMQKTFKGLAKKNIKEGSAKKLKLGKVGSEDGEGFEMV